MSCRQGQHSSLCSGVVLLEALVALTVLSVTIAALQRVQWSSLKALQSTIARYEDHQRLRKQVLRGAPCFHRQKPFYRVECRISEKERYVFFPAQR